MLQQNRKLADEYVRLLQQAVTPWALLVVVRRGFEARRWFPAAISGGSFVSAILTLSISQQSIVIVEKSFRRTTYLRGFGDSTAVADVYEVVLVADHDGLGQS
jgi:hypothetical protein